MNKKAIYLKVTAPTLFLTKGKQRLKQYDNVVYLNDGDEFELELFNPTEDKILAKIKLNDYELSSGIILRPGERVFLERYLDEARKFIFETYKVDENDPNVKEAIKANGKVEVNFYQRKYDYNIWICNNNNNIINTPINPPNLFETGTPVWTSNTGNITYGAGDSVSYCCSNTLSYSDGTAEQEKNIETGRVEKGSYSDQTFVYDNTEFSSYPTWTVSWKILPFSQKGYKKEDLAVYCTGCGAKRKKDSHKFCPHCGTKY